MTKAKIVLPEDPLKRTYKSLFLGDYFLAKENPGDLFIRTAAKSRHGNLSHYSAVSLVGGSIGRVYTFRDDEEVVLIKDIDLVLR